MPRRLQLVEKPRIGSFVFISPFASPPYKGLYGQVTRVNRGQAVVKFEEGLFDEFPPILLMELIEI